MKVSIVTEGFQNTGYGHITRCISIAQAFEERNIFPTLFINGDENSESFFHNNHFKIINWLQKPTSLLAEVKNSDVIIIDSYLAGKEFYENLSKIGKISLFIDDNLRIDYPTGIILNGTVNAENFPYARKAGQEYLLGSRFIPLRKEFWNVPPRKINHSVNSILVTFGGQDIKNLTLPVLNALNEIYPAVKKNVVIGSGFAQTKEIENLRSRSVELFYSPGSAKMFELMISSDLAITAAGQTLYELAATGTPAIAIEVADNQKNNISEWKKKSFLHDPVFHGDINVLRKVVAQVEKFQSVSIRKKLSGIGKENVDGQGSRRAVDYIIGKICEKQNFYLRTACEFDSQKVFELSNDPSVRGQSINRSSIDWNEHTKWFAKKMSDDNYIFLLAFDKKDNFIGQVRFQLENETAVISISIAQEFRGKGLSKKILSESCTNSFQQSSGLKTILAFIRPENSASVRGFKSAGFEYDSEEIIGGEKFLKYSLKRKS